MGFISYLWVLYSCLLYTSNIYKELQDDLGIAPAEHGDLSCWADEGVMLLNRVLSVRESDAGSHRGKGWEEITECAIRALVARNQPLVGLLWGAESTLFRSRCV